MITMIITVSDNVMSLEKWLGNDNSIPLLESLFSTKKGMLGSKIEVYLCYGYWKYIFSILQMCCQSV
jgi:hypothetical protein